MTYNSKSFILRIITPGLLQSFVFLLYYVLKEYDIQKRMEKQIIIKELDLFREL